ncbi:MAG: hypothetical protein IKL62_02335 [Clostridia bacterium]|nr:hypothetical protein [Clostridia bacterium]
MTLKLFGIKIKITFLFSAIICLMLFIDRTGLIIPLFLAVGVHELAHLFAMKGLGCAPGEIELIPGSIKIINPQRYNRKKENIILLCGPLSNLLLFALFYLGYSFSGYRQLAVFGVVQLVVALFNLLPARGLDGGALLYNFLLKITTVTRASLLFLIISVFTGTFFLTFAMISAFSGSINPSMIILGIYIIILAFSK